MACQTHSAHNHKHAVGCGHMRLRHNGHEDYLHDGHLHHVHGDHVDEHSIEVGSANRADCDQGHSCTGHAADHKHGPGCGHEAVPHGDHVDYLVDGHLHHAHGSHCDDHGRVQVVA
jgi:hypothetical protein